MYSSILDRDVTEQTNIHLVVHLESKRCYIYINFFIECKSTFPKELDCGYFFTLMPSMSLINSNFSEAWVTLKVIFDPYLFRCYQLGDGTLEIIPTTVLLCCARLAIHGTIPYSLTSLKYQRCYNQC